MADKTAIMKEAQKYLARGQLDKAIAEWEKLIRESPDGNTFNMVGDLYLKKGDKKAAVESFHKAAGYFRQEGFSLKALALYKKVLNISQTDSAALYALGELSEEKGLATDATRYYLAAADGLSKEGKKDQLLDIYQKILSLSPTNVPLRNKVAEIFLKEGLKSDAVKEYLFIARTFEDKGDFSKAAEYYGKIGEIQPPSREVALAMTHLHQKSGDIAKAVAVVKEATGLFPDDADLLFRKAELLIATGDHAAASESLYKIEGLDPGNMRAKRLLGDLFIRQGRKEEAWEKYLPVIDDMILQANYDDPTRLLDQFRDVAPLDAGRRLASLYRLRGEPAAAAAELALLGDALKEKELKDEALGCYRDALDLNPDDARVRNAIAELEEKPEERAEPEAVAEPGPIAETEAVEEEAVSGVIDGEKTVEEFLTEADIFSRYGLLNEAIKILEGLKLKRPQNEEVHNRLKALYVDASDKESAVTECLILSELYKRKGDPEQAEKMLREAAGISPEDPRLAERGVIPELEPTSYASETPQFGQPGIGEPDIEDYEEEIAEADFYVRQGLIQEASKILERLHSLFPDNTEVADRLTNLGQLAETEEESPLQSPLEVDGAAQEKLAREVTGPEEKPFGMSGAEFELPETADEETVAPEETPLGVSGAGFELPETADEETPGAGPTSEEGAFEEISFSEEDLVDAQEMPEPELDNDVLEIFQEFKKGLEKELGEEDSETHYNLGIAYKEMGLVDDAIKEFQTSRNDPKRFMQSSTMLALCYMEKGMYSLVIGVLSSVLEQVSDKDESFWAVKYDLADAYEKSGNADEARRLYTEVFGWNAKFRSVAEKVSRPGGQTAAGGPAGKAGDTAKPKTKKDRVSYL